MVSLKKIISCKCGASNSFSFDSDMNIEEIAVSARCSMCGALVHISVSSLLSPPKQPEAAQPSAPTQEEIDAETKANVEQAVRDLFRY